MLHWFASLKPFLGILIYGTEVHVRATVHSSWPWHRLFAFKCNWNVSSGAFFLTIENGSVVLRPPKQEMSAFFYPIVKFWLYSCQALDCIRRVEYFITNNIVITIDISLFFCCTWNGKLINLFQIEAIRTCYTPSRAPALHRFTTKYMFSYLNSP